MRDLVCGVFRSIFLFGHGFTVITLISAAVVLVAWKAGLWTPLVPTVFVALFLIAPAGLALTFSKPQFTATSASTKRQPKPMRELVGLLNRWEAQSVSVYERHYTARFRLIYGTLITAVLASATHAVRQVWDAPSSVLLFLGGIFTLIMTLILCAANWLASRGSVGRTQ